MELGKPQREGEGSLMISDSILWVIQHILGGGVRLMKAAAAVEIYWVSSISPCLWLKLFK